MKKKKRKKGNDKDQETGNSSKLKDQCTNTPKNLNNSHKAIVREQPKMAISESSSNATVYQPLP